MHSASLVWITPNAEQVVIDCARVSSDKPPGEPGAKLLSYLIAHKHWSPFTMANMCVEIITTRDISRQILRHSSLDFQEFSQRYAPVPGLLGARSCRLQHPTNRQRSLPCEDPFLENWWRRRVQWMQKMAEAAYQEALAKGIAREVARALLPEGLAPTRLYANGTLRSWIHFIEARDHEDAQLEVQLVAQSIRRLFTEQCPTIMEAMDARS